MAGGGLRVGVDVGGTFTKAVAVGTRPVALRASAVVPTTHDAGSGVTEGVAEALRTLLGRLGREREQVELVAFSTTTAMNALLEGDVAAVGVIGVGAEPELRLSRRRTHVGEVKLAPGRVLRTEHAFLDATRGLDPAEVDAAVERLVALGCTAVAVSGAFAVDAPEHEQTIRDRAREHGLPACGGSELTGAYGLETRTISAAINASILPVVERTAGIVEAVLHEAGIDVPLLVLRGDGGSMSLDAFRRAPSFTIGSGPAAGVAAALHELSLHDGIVLECGGTSSNVSVVVGGRTAMRTLRVMGRPTSIRSVDSWVVGAAGGSMARLGRRRVEETGPRSAHVAGLPYACFAPLAELDGATLDVVAPRAGDPEAYAIVRGRSGVAYALTATCAAHAAGLAHGALVPEGHDARSSALAAFAPLGAKLRRTPEEAARAFLEGAVQKIARVVDEAAHTHDLGHDVPVVALGGAGLALAPEVARVLGRPLVRPDHPEVLSSIGAALSLVRSEVTRHVSGPHDTLAASHAAERACVDAGAAPQTVTVETSYHDRERLVRAVATGAVALESGAAAREPVDDDARLAAAARALGTREDELDLLAGNEYYRVYADDGSGRVAVVDGVGAVPLAERAARRVVASAEAGGLLEPLRGAVEEGAVNLGVAALLPRVVIVCGPRIVDLSDARRVDEILSAAAAVVAGQEGAAVAVVRG